MRERVADDFGLLVDFLRHEMAMVALVDEERRRGRFLDRALDLLAGLVVHLRALAAEHRPVAVFQIADRVGERRQRNGVGAEIHLAVAVADRERRALARADQQVLLALEQERQRERAAQARQRRLDRLRGRAALLHLLGDEMRDDFGVGFGLEDVALGLQLFAQLAEILDDAVVHDRDLVGRMRMRVDFVGLAVRRPARVADAGMARERLAHQALFEVLQFAFGAAAREVAAFERRDAG